MTRGTDLPNCSVWQNNPVLGVGVNFFAKRLLESLLYPIAILGVDLLSKIFSRRYARPWIQSVNMEHFLGTEQHLFRAGIPSPTACMRQLLRFGQIILTSHQSFLDALALGQIDDERKAFASFLEQSGAHKHGNAATVFP